MKRFTNFAFLKENQELLHAIVPVPKKIVSHKFFWFVDNQNFKTYQRNEFTLIYLLMSASQHIFVKEHIEYMKFLGFKKITLWILKTTQTVLFLNSSHFVYARQLSLSRVYFILFYYLRVLEQLQVESE